MLYFKPFLLTAQYSASNEGVQWWCNTVFGSGTYNTEISLAENIEAIINSLKTIVKKIARSTITLNNMCYLNAIPKFVEHNTVDYVPFTGEGAIYTGFASFVPSSNAISTTQYSAWATSNLPKKYSDSTHASQVIMEINDAIWYMNKVNNEIIATIGSLKMIK